MTRQLALDKSCYYYVERGRIYMQASRFAEAIEDFREAIALRPDDWAAYNNAGCCYKSPAGGGGGGDVKEGGRLRGGGKKRASLRKSGGLL